VKSGQLGQNLPDVKDIFFVNVNNEENHRYEIGDDNLQRINLCAISCQKPSDKTSDKGDGKKRAGKSDRQKTKQRKTENEYTGSDNRQLFIAHSFDFLNSILNS